ncbi:hypothetical protein Ptr902_11845 [Pyrenophora tritici-repentis]|nr:hypothetical protein Ptr902_11845 [Pyrenophora tritici-repentis]
MSGISPVSLVSISVFLTAFCSIAATTATYYGNGNSQTVQLGSSIHCSGYTPAILVRDGICCTRFADRVLTSRSRMACSSGNAKYCCYTYYRMGRCHSISVCYISGWKDIQINIP